MKHLEITSSKTKTNPERMYEVLKNLPPKVLKKLIQIIPSLGELFGNEIDYDEEIPK